MTIRDELNEISKQRKKDEKNHEKLKKKHAEEREKLNAKYLERKDRLERISQRIMSGGSTGDKVFDFGVVCYGFTEEEELEGLRELEGGSRENIDNPVLIVNQELRDYGPKYMFPPANHQPLLGIETRMSLGILAKEARFDLKNKKVVFPCGKKHAHRKNHERWELGHGDLSIDAYDLFYLGRVLTTGHLEEPDERESRQVPISLMEEWASRKGLQIHFGRGVEKRFLEARKMHFGDTVKTISDYSYYAAMRLLGREIAGFRQGYAKEISPDADRLLEDLAKLRAREARFVTNIRKAEKEAVGGFHYFDDGDRVTKTPLDKYLARDRKDLESVRGGIVALLQSSIDTGIFGLGIKLEGTRVKPIDVDTELRRLAEDYNFKLPA